MPKFSVTYETYPAATDDDEDSYCENAESGFIIENVSLREAIDYAQCTESNHCSQSGIEASDSDMPRWFTVYNSANWDNGETENRALHIPENVTRSSRRRIARLLGVRT